MEKKEIIPYLNKKIRINLVNNFFYTGFIEEINENSLKFCDKFGNMLTTQLSDVRFVIECKSKEKLRIGEKNQIRKENEENEDEDEENEEGDKNRRAIS